MVNIFREIENREELAALRNKFGKDPRFAALSNAILFELNESLPCTKLFLYSLIVKSKNTTYYYALKRHTHTSDHAVLCYDGGLSNEDFLEGLAFFMQVAKFYKNKEEFLLMADETLAELFCANIKENNLPYTTDCTYAIKYFMTEDQEKIVVNMKPDKIPEGYCYDVAKVEEAELITDTWVHASKGELEQTREKLRRLPTTAIRFEGKLASFEMVEPLGFLNHLYTLPEHRRKGLGNAVERDLARKCIREGLVIFKTVEHKNKFVLESADRSPIWTRYGPDKNVFVVAIPK